MPRYHTVILGGGKSPLDSSLPKGNTLFNGRPLAEIAYTAVKDTHQFDRIAVVMNPDSYINLRPEDRYVQPASCQGAWRSGYKGISTIDDQQHNYVLVAGDLPFLRKEVIEEFMREIEQMTNVGIVIPLVRREVNQKVFPQRKRTYQPLQEGEFVAGNLGYISQEALQKNERLLEGLASSYQQKFKFILRAISLLGINTVLRSSHPRLPLVNSIPAY